MKECSMCHIIKPLSDFYKHSKTKDGYDSNCKQCKYKHPKGYTKPALTYLTCRYCKKSYPKNRKGILYCSRDCYLKALQNCKNDRDMDIIKAFNNNDIELLSVKNGYTKGEMSLHVKQIIIPYLLDKQSHLCAICGCPDKWNSKPLVFILDHINGDWKDHRKENIRLICPNCNSQLDTTKHHKGKGRYSNRVAYWRMKDSLN